MDPNIIIIKTIIVAMCVVESGNNPAAVGDNGQAIGILQQHKIFVDDVNRVLKTTWGKQEYPGVEFKYDDRADPQKAKDMALIWLRYYSRKWPLEKCVRWYNAGKNWQCKQAEKYWHTVNDIAAGQK